MGSCQTVPKLGKWKFGKKALYYLFTVLISSRQPHSHDYDEIMFDYLAISTPFAIHYEKIPIHLREMATNGAKIHSLAPKNEQFRVTQIQ